MTSRSAGRPPGRGQARLRSPIRSAVRPFGPGIYIHVPFCRRRCGYCDFYTEIAGPERRREYVADLLREIELASEVRPLGDQTVQTVFLGGGTPSLLTGREMAAILDRLRKHFHLDPGAEITAEANPESLTPSRMAAFRQAGVNRISLGVQSFHDRELKLLDRLHGQRLARRRLQELREEGFTSVGLDLIYGLPGSSPGRWKETLEAALECEPDHLSAYLLTLELHVPMSRAQIRGDVPPLPLDDETEEEYRILRRLTHEAGLRQYEISNFAHPGHESRHNQNYWTRGEYLGLGPAAHSHAQARRWFNPASLHQWRDSIQDGAPAWSEGEEIGPLEAAEEWVFLGLRLTRGIEWKDLTDLLQPDRLSSLEKAAAQLQESGHLERTASRLRLKPRAYFLSNAVFRILMEAIQ